MELAAIVWLLPTIQLNVRGDVYETPSTIIELVNAEGFVVIVIETVGLNAAVIVPAPPTVIVLFPAVELLITIDGEFELHDVNE